MESKRKRYKADFKFKVALEAVKERQTISELSSQFGVHSTQIAQWKKHLLEAGIIVFKEGTRGGKEDQPDLIDQLYQQVGKLQVELTWLKKKL